jgi:CheY-like chemotaxis protein
MADHTRLKQIILNLLSNAIKYNHYDGRVIVRCRYTAERRVCIEVSDTGYGIPDDKLNSLFEPFNRLDTNPKRIEGTGIGLSISKKLSEMMKGKLKVKSEIGRGSTFWIELEDARVTTMNGMHEDQTDPANTTTVDSSDLLYKQKILIVEDNPSNLKLISSQLSILGYRADLACNGKEALKMTAKNDYALVITDCNMPIMDGYELTTEIRKNNSRIPVIALTADAFPEREQQCLTAGMNARMVKPVDLKQLGNVLNTWL